jgi:hypothetical protein
MDMLEGNFFESFFAEENEKAFQLLNALEIYLDKQVKRLLVGNMLNRNVTIN